MRLAISNIAWDIAEDEAAATLLTRYGLDTIDIAPGKYFADPARATAAEIARVRAWWKARGIAISGMQSLLFGTTGLNLFAAPHVQQAMLDQLGAACRIAAMLGATRLVFGSPRNRDRSGLTDADALKIATGFFGRLGDIAARYGVTICLEPNPPRYGSNFMTTSAETAQVVERVAHHAIKMQFDTGALTINGEMPETVLAASSGLIGYIHASEPDLLPLGDCGTDHGRIYAALRRYLPDNLVSVEMVLTKDEPHLAAVERALSAAVSFYRPAGPVLRSPYQP